MQVKTHRRQKKKKCHKVINNYCILFFIRLQKTLAICVLRNDVDFIVAINK